MNRASIGVQDFDDDIQQAIGRIQGYEVTRDTVEALRAHGIQSLNADILYGLPHQNQARIAESVQMLLSLSPDRVALYGYAHVPWMAKRQAMIPTDALPTPEERLHLFNTARACSSGTAMTRSASTISRDPPIAWPSPRAPGICAATSRATPTTPATC
jgi:oxygen-independent coproporphyrinogen-3 oxidase